MTADRIPVRADLAGSAPLFYPIVEKRRFGSVEAMCAPTTCRRGWERAA